MSATNFLTRYGAAFGRAQSLTLRMTGLTAGEVSAKGAWVTDENGRRWLDFGSYGLHLLGHCHPNVVAAAAEQLPLMGLSSKMMGGAEATACAEALSATLPERLQGVMFANTGSEAVESALRLARLATGRSRVVALRRSYHGKTAGALAVSDSLSRHRGLGDALPVSFIDPGDLDGLRRRLAAGDVAAVIAEPIQGEGGIFEIEESFLAAMGEATAAAGAVFILDEIQTGLGRCGRIWAAARRLAPDIVLAGKTLGGGLLPLAAVIYDPRRFGPAATDPIVHASSFAGGPLACRVGRAVLATVTTPGFTDRISGLGDTLLGMLREALEGAPGVVEVRGRGLMAGIELATPEQAGQAIIHAAQKGLLLTFCLNRPSVLRIYPPAVIGRDDFERGVEAASRAVRQAAETIAA